MHRKHLETPRLLFSFCSKLHRYTWSRLVLWFLLTIFVIPHNECLREESVFRLNSLVI